MADPEPQPISASESPLRIRTYHCLCSTHILSTRHNLDDLSRRSEPVQDGALILPPQVTVSGSSPLAIDDASNDRSESIQSALSNVLVDRKPIIIRREDGFEKRTVLRCVRCRLVLGYQLDEAHYGMDKQVSRPIYLLPGGLIDTEAMVKGSRPEIPSWAEQTA